MGDEQHESQITNEIIRKPQYIETPNLADYDKTYRSFTWDDARKEIDYFANGKLNVAHNAIDRHALTWRKNKVAMYWEGQNGEKEKYTFTELKFLTNKFANVLANLGIQKGDRVFIFLPRIPQLYIAFLGIIKTGAIAGTLFSAFGPAALKDRLHDSGAKAIITCNELKQRVYDVRNELPELKHIIIADKDSGQGEVNFHAELDKASRNFNVAHMDPNDIAFMLYTSGTTGKPKGVVHSHGDIVQEHLSAKWALDLHENDVFWCTADPGWVTGIVYEILGTWSNGISQIIHAGRFDPEKWYSIIQDYQVTVWYTAPTAIRMLMKAGMDALKKYDLSSLRDINSVGEPLNPEAIRWGEKAFGLPFHDGWWQTETGSILICNYPVLPVKIGSMGKPFPGITAAIIDDNGNVLPPETEGNLAIKAGWPAMMKGIWNNEEKYRSYFKGEWYLSGDRAFMDPDGYFWFVGRADDVIKTSGERVGPFEVESALVEHPAIAEAGVIGKPDAERGAIIKAFCTLKPGFVGDDNLKSEIQKFIKSRLAGHAYPREIEFVASLPKTRSGKIMRRILKAKELGEPIGDTSTLEEY
ncbi:MAG: Acyl-coenzyme A synthetase/AMP-(fatty) acid ligase, acetyl-CoA synthetase [archaeon GW2011_AR3]|nr:MAG: Acyl-coenzyme A synthetase/AMP-(fatty) acid ligase, acetyl-CoA synthetase [archaeon GW2011_AR3]MBS3109372.1 acetate--CoA ligase [Candidatus Woesearchaeota archaeon]